MLEEDDELADVRLTGGNDTLMLATVGGKAIHIRESDVRVMGRPAHGVRGIDLEPGDSVIGMQVVRDGATLLTVTRRAMESAPKSANTSCKIAAARAFSTTTSPTRRGLWPACRWWTRPTTSCW